MGWGEKDVEQQRERAKRHDRDERVDEQQHALLRAARVGAEHGGEEGLEEEVGEQRCANDDVRLPVGGVEAE